jgi:hypothetical protein
MNTGFSSVVKACAVVVAAMTVACSGTAQRPAEMAAAQPTKACQADTVYGNAALERVSGCAEIQGDLRISGVTTLEPLAGLTKVHGTLTIEDSPKLAKMTGLEQLSHVDGLVLSRTGLFTTQGLEGLRVVKRLAVAENPRLISVAGLNQVREVGQVVIVNNPRLSGYYGLLPGLAHNPSRVVIEGNRGLAKADTAALSQVRVLASTARNEATR